MLRRLRLLARFRGGATTGSERHHQEETLEHDARVCTSRASRKPVKSYRRPRAAVIELCTLDRNQRLSLRTSPVRTVSFWASKYSASGMANLRDCPVRSLYCCASI